MFYCYVHNWYDNHEPCPECNRITITTSGNTEPVQIISQCSMEIDKLQAELSQVKAERDRLMEVLDISGKCPICKGGLFIVKECYRCDYGESIDLEPPTTNKEGSDGF